METYRGLPSAAFATPNAWEAWLERNHDFAEGIWLQFAKKNSGITTVTYEEAREVALRYGWIDGLLNALDEQYYCIRFTKRKPRSVWSKINRTIVEGLIEQGRMHPAGLAQVEAAKADGRWDAAYDSPSAANVPEDFQKALDQSSKAQAAFAALSKSSRYSFIWRLQTARTPETRAKHIAKFIQALEDGNSQA